MLDESGKDATESFEDVGHSEEAREIMHKMYVGEFKDDVSRRDILTRYSCEQLNNISPGPPAIDLITGLHRTAKRFDHA